MAPKLWTDEMIEIETWKTLGDENIVWADYMDIGMFLHESAFGVEVGGKDVPTLSDEEYFVLGAYFTDTVFNGDIGKAYEYTYELKPYNYVEQ